MHQNYPRLTLELSVALTADLQQMMAHGEIDLALMPCLRFDPNLPGPVASATSRFAWMVQARRFHCRTGVIEPCDFRDLRVLSLGKRQLPSPDRRGSGLALAVTKRGRSISATALGAIASLTQAGARVSLLPVQSATNKRLLRAHSECLRPGRRSRYG
ncbi:LysR substrate-binding domain-containing protein [Methylobacterium oryzae CBMB20]